MKFLERTKQRAKTLNKTIVLPETYDIRTLKAADAVLREGAAKIVLLGNRERILAKAEGLDLSKATFIDPQTYERTPELIDKLYGYRKEKGMTREEAARLLMENELYLGVMLVKEGVADGMVAGAANSTANVFHPVVRILKTAPGVKLVSAFFMMVVPECQYGESGLFLFGDCGMVQNPNAEELAAIAASSAKSFQLLAEAEPAVAMLSFSTKGSSKSPDTEKVIEATRIAREQNPNLLLDGELQLDAAIVPGIGASKAPCSPVAGRANVLVFPDLDAGNIAYKIVERLAKAEAYGPITQGVAKPVNDLSRGCAWEDIVGVICITCVQCGA